MIRFSANQYSKFYDFKNQPNIDLLDPIKHLNIGKILDLGCGDGSLSTFTLRTTYPTATILGIDHDAEIIRSAKSINDTTYICDSIEQYQPNSIHDLVNFSGSLQWCKNHKEIINKYAKQAKNISIQMPDMFNEPFYTCILETAAELSLPMTKFRLSPVLNDQQYTQICEKISTSHKIWNCEYTHTLHGQNSLLEWAKGAPLRPIFSFDKKMQDVFLDLYNAKLKQRYEYSDSYAILPFKRKFILLTEIQP